MMSKCIRAVYVLRGYTRGCMYVVWAGLRVQVQASGLQYLSPMGSSSPLASFLSSITRELSTATSSSVFTCALASSLSFLVVLLFSTINSSWGGQEGRGDSHTVVCSHIIGGGER